MTKDKELYCMFKHKHPIGSWTVGDISLRMNISESEARDVLDFAKENGFAKENEVGGYFHSELCPDCGGDGCVPIESTGFSGLCGRCGGSGSIVY